MPSGASSPVAKSSACGSSRSVMGRSTCTKPSTASSTSAAISTNRNAPVTQAFVRMLKHAVTVASTITMSAVASGSRPAIATPR